ncbi:MAG: hypothetical protein AAB588_00155 [Patescibacteria group bacterium]
MEGRNSALEVERHALPYGVLHRKSPILQRVKRATPLRDIGNWVRRNTLALILFSAGTALGAAHAWDHFKPPQTPSSGFGPQPSPSPTLPPNLPTTVPHLRREQNIDTEDLPGTPAFSDSENVPG